jgi:hypothetical protein
MRIVRILQVGDIHYPDAVGVTLADLGDSAFPPILLDTMLLKPLQRIVRAATTAHADCPLQGILLCGDLTTRGRLDGYEACVDYLSNALGLNGWQRHRVHVVPGNHDVDRSAIDPAGIDLSAKFAPFAMIWASRNLSDLTVGSMRESTIASGKNEVAVYSLNSAIGCGEKRFLPPSISDGLSALLDGLVAKEGLEKAFSIVGETLDTPGFRESDIDSVCSRIRALPERSVPLLLAHHNLLPQAILRLQLYAEVMNAGHVRSRLTRLDRNILFCHGHIHDDPIEVISNPDNPLTRVISISAPEFTRGFNILQIEFGSRGFPLGLKVLRYQLSPRDGDVSIAHRYIPFYAAGKHFRTLGHPKLPAILANMGDKEIRFLETLDKIRAAGISISKPAFAELLREGEWLGALYIADRERVHDYWTIERVLR